MDEKLRDGILFRLLAVGAGLALSGLLLVFIDRNPIEVYRILFASLFRDKYTFFDIFVKATPLIFTGLAFTFTYKASLFNIGAQGQFYIGAVVAVSVSLSLAERLPGAAVLMIAFSAILAAGGAWGALIGFFKARYQANEFLTSMMSTYVALNFMNYLLRTVLKETKGEYPQTNPLAKSVWLPKLVQGTRLHWGFVIAVLTAVLVWVVLYRTPFGFRIRAVGLNQRAAEMSGIDAKKLYVLTFFISGALAAAAGLTEVNGMQHMLVQGFNPTIGSEGLGIAILANANPIAIIFTALLFGALRVGGLVAAQVAGIPPSFIELMQGFVMIFVILSNYQCAAMDRAREIRKLRKAAA